MLTFEEHLREVDAESSGVNVVFEAGMFSTRNNLEQLLKALQTANIPFEIVGGVAVNLWVKSKGNAGITTRDIDVLVDRRDLPAIVLSGEAFGYQAQKMMGGYALIRAGQPLGEAVHLLFVGEKSRSTQPFPHPALDPQLQSGFGLSIPVAPLLDLLQMKLTSFRPKDIVHLELLDDVGLITQTLEQQLPLTLRERLEEARRQTSAGRPDVD